MLILNSLKIEEIIDKNNSCKSSFVFRHLPPGMGVTLGNYLRRCLLEYISGIAPIAVKISDKNGLVKTSFSVLEGVLEVTPYLIINLKKIAFKEKKSEGIFSLELNVENQEKEEKIITAGDFSKSKEVEIKNPELKIATLAAASSDKKNSKLEIKLYCQKNWGYHGAEEQKKDFFAREKDVIVLNTNYSPIKEEEGGIVNFQVKEVVVNFNQKEEELILTISTNGAIKPKKALQESLEISRNLFDKIVNLTNNEKEKNIKEIATN